MSEFLMVNEAARLIGVAGSTIILYERTGRLNAMKTERGVRLFKRQDVERFRQERDQRRDAQAAESLTQSA